MGWFLENHSAERTMLMGHWLSQAFLACTRPQVIDWTNNMSRDVIRHDSFTVAGGFDMADPDIARIPPAGSMVPTPLSSFKQFTWPTEGERVKSKDTTSGEGTSMDLEPNLGVALDFAKLCLG